MAPCRFFAQGNCRNGDNCRFEHILPGGGGHQGSSNRFAPLQNQNNSRNDSRGNTGFNNRQAPPRELPFQLDKSSIEIDLSNERPQWLLSAYGPGRHAPAQLFGGPQREQSFEEMRLAHYVAVAAGNPQVAIQQANEAYTLAEQQVQNALSNLDGAIDYVIKAQHEHPNRIDTITGSNAGPQTGVFSKGAATQTNPFGSASTPAFGAPSQPSAFGTPSQPGAFGAPSQPSGFGQPSALGQRPNPFGPPSAPAFGAPSQAGGGTSSFGQSSALGQKTNPFGAPSGSGGSFGQPSSFGAPSQPPSNPFGVPSQAPSAFGAPSQLGAKPNPFGQPSSTPFGAPSAPANPFGGGQQQSTTGPANPFGRPSASTTPFGAPSAPSQASPFGASSSTAASNPFGQPSQPPVTNPFGAPPAVANPFGAPSSAPSNPFGAPSTKPPSTTSPFKQVNGTSSGGYIPSTGGDVSTYTSKDMSGRLTTFKGRRVEYKENEPGYIGSDGSWCRIFFPDGPPTHTTQTTTDPSDQYDSATEAAYKRLLETGEFPEGGIPLLPPKKEWLRWDF